MDLTQLPFNRLIGLRRSEKDGYVFCLPADVAYTNHVGTVHAAALFSLAEATAGQCLLESFPELSTTAIPVLRRIEASYRKPALGAIHSQAHLDPAVRSTFLQTFAAKGRAGLKVEVSVEDESGTKALQATTEWFVARAPGE